LGSNTSEGVEVYISGNLNGPWYQLNGEKFASDYDDNWIPFYMENSKLEGTDLPFKIGKAVWIKVKDSNSHLVESPFYSGFEVSSVRIQYPCSPFIS